MSNHLKGHNSLADMVSTHITVWQYLLNEKLVNATSDVDVHYYNHELSALEDIKAACAIEKNRWLRAEATMTLVYRRLVDAKARVINQHFPGGEANSPERVEWSEILGLLWQSMTLLAPDLSHPDDASEARKEIEHAMGQLASTTATVGTQENDFSRS